MSKIVKPLLARKAEYDKIKYPVYATPKLDGIRCLIVDGVPMSRNMKPIPNHFVREELSDLDQLDGELMVEGDFNNVQSGIMSQDGEPDFTMFVFDTWSDDATGGYLDRLQFIDDMEIEWHPRVKILRPIEINSEEDLDIYLDRCLEKGYEGVMIRQPDSPYKHGRSTVNEGYLLKIKRFHDDEAILVDVLEKMHNANELEQDEFGHAKRSSCKDNLVPANTAGSLVLNWQGIEFKVGFGPGQTDSYKQDIWDNRAELVGKHVTFRYQELSKDNIPRFGKLVGFRHPDDM